jgi:hypothetical protein
VLQTGGEVDLALEPLRAQRGRELRQQHLEGDRPLVTEVLGEVNRGHAAAPELALEGIAAGEGVAEGFRDSDGELLGRSRPVGDDAGMSGDEK